MTSVRHRAALVAMVSVILPGCPAPVDNPSAYDSEAYLCDAENASLYETWVADCRQRWEDDGSCAGIISFTGVLQGLPVTVDAELDGSESVEFNFLDGRRVLDELRLDGASPYFRFRLAYKDVGGTLDGAAEGRTLSFAESGTLDPEIFLYDDRTRGSLRLSVGSESVDLSARSGASNVVVQREDEHAATFDASFGEDWVEGCFVALLTSRRTRTETTVEAP